MTSITDPTTPTNEVCPPWCHAPHPAGDMHLSAQHEMALTLVPPTIGPDDWTGAPSWRPVKLSIYVDQLPSAVMPVLHVDVDGQLDAQLDEQCLVFTALEALEFRCAISAAVDAISAGLGAV